MTKHRLKTSPFLAIAVVASLGMGLTACGGGSDSADNTPTTNTDAAAMEAKALADAQAAARAAWRAARNALAGIAGLQGANAAAYQRAVNAVADAEAAYEAAAAATTSAEAKRHQADAEDASTDAMTQAGIVVASFEADDLKTAQMAAKSAADAAKKAYDDAKKAVMDVESVKDTDIDSYNTAVAKRDAAKAAYDAAQEASDAAAGTSVLADAEASQKTAEAELDKANTANDEAMKYAGMVQDAEGNALVAAKTAAQNAYDAAKMAYDTAKQRVDDLEDKKADNVEDYVRAVDALVPVKAAYDAAAAANAMAQDAETSADAETHQAAVETQKAAVDTRAGVVNDFAMLVETAYTAAQKVRDDEETRISAVMDARKRAIQSYMAADADADKAEVQAAEAEENAPGSPGAVAARQAATDARKAANDAKAAHDAIADGMTEDEANAQAKLAADEAVKANSGYMTAKAENDDIKTTGGLIAENDRKQAVADARKYGGQAADDAKTAADAARIAANAAKSAHEDAMAEYERAKSARTDAPNAKKAVDEAHAAYMAADSAANDAHAAYLAAKAAVDGVMDDSSKPDADGARDTAEEQQGIATGHQTTAMMKQTEAEGAEKKAEMYADDHVVGLLQMANALHITTANDPDANLDETELALIRKNVNAHIAMVNTAISTANGDTTDTTIANQHGGGTVTASYPYYASLGDNGTFGGTDADADTGPGEGKPQILVNPEGGGDAVALAHDDATTEDTVETNFDLGPGLGDFVHEKYFGQNNDTDADGTFDTGETRQRIVLFTDIKQASPPIPQAVVSYFGEAVVQSRIATVNTATPVTDTERDYNATYDHDGIAGTAPIAVVLNCGTTCSLRVVDGDIVSISGYTFSTAGDVTVPGVAPVADDTWLAFGIWLQETATDAVNTYTFGAFADGGAAIGETGEPTAVASVTGDATYSGKAAGVHSTATKVEFFHGDATLNAEFGDGAADGTITGKIHNIMSGGRTVDDDIELLISDPGAGTPVPNIAAAGTFTGQARMTDTGRDDNSGEDIYRLTGGWSGTFYNHMTDDATTTPLDESTRAPGSVAGTFGVGMADDTDTDTMGVETESYVGAFGAHCSGANCNPHD